jgi:membrane associated rhomboid family serine protease
VIPLKDYPGPRRSFPWVMLTILVVNVLVFVFELGVGSAADLDALFSSAGVVPVEYTRGVDVGLPPPLGIVWLTLITSMFLHGGFLHIASNMLFLFIFGDNVERLFGSLKYLIFYLLCGIAADFAQVYSDPNSVIPSLGASGAISGVLAAYVFFFPKNPIRVLLTFGYFIRVQMVPAFVMIGLWIVIQLVSGIGSIAETAQTGGVAYFAHIGGFAAGILLAFLLRPFVDQSGTRFAAAG